MNRGVTLYFIDFLFMFVTYTTMNFNFSKDCINSVRF